MGRLDLRDTYRDEDYQMGGDVRNPASRQVRTPHAKSGRDPAHGQRGRSVTGTPLNGVGVVGARCPHVPTQMSVDDCIAVAATPPMPEGFTDRAAWDAIHWRLSAGGSVLDEAVIGWQLANQERVAAAARAASRV